MLNKLPGRQLLKVKAQEDNPDRVVPAVADEQVVCVVRYVSSVGELLLVAKVHRAHLSIGDDTNAFPVGPVGYEYNLIYRRDSARTEEGRLVAGPVDGARHLGAREGLGREI